MIGQENYMIGDTVLAYWQPSDAYFVGTVVEKVDTGFVVLFEDGDEAAVPAAKVRRYDLNVGSAVIARWNDGEITVEFNLIGDRPVGMTPTSSPLVQVAALAFATIGIELRELGISSTDSNVPMSLGIPAITIAGGGQGGGSHSPDEWFSPTNSHRGPQIALLLTLGMVGIEGLSAALLAERTP